MVQILLAVRMSVEEERLAFSYDWRSLSPSDFVRTLASSISCIPFAYAANLSTENRGGGSVTQEARAAGE